MPVCFHEALVFYQQRNDMLQIADKKRRQKINKTFPACVIDQRVVGKFVHEGQLVNNQHYFSDQKSPNDRRAKPCPGDAVLAKNQPFGDQDKAEGNEKKNRAGCFLITSWGAAFYKSFIILFNINWFP